jgi:S-adenosylmethionine-diacylglycerol 3-amino-3-carboxypropyl transferase
MTEMALSTWVDDAAALPLAFAQVREDAVQDVWLAARQGGPLRVLMTASGGCTAAALAASGYVRQLHLVDPNPAQLALTRLKLRLLETAATADRLRILGHAPMPAVQRRARLTAELDALGLPADALGPIGVVAALGPDFAGRYERLFVALRAAMADSGAALEAVLQLTDPREQARRVGPGTALGRALDDAFDQVFCLDNLVCLFGAAATANRVEPFARHFAARTRHVLATMPAADNPYLWQMLAGRFPAAASAPWLAAAPSPQMPGVTWTSDVMDAALRAAAPGSFDLIHLSNILDWLKPADARATLELARTALRPGGRVVIRQLNSALDVRSAGSLFSWDACSEALHARDRSFFYRALHIGAKP